MSDFSIFFDLFASMVKVIHQTRFDFVLWTIISAVQIAIYVHMLRQTYRRKSHLIEAPIFRIFFFFLFLLGLHLLNNGLMSIYAWHSEPDYMKLDSFYSYCLLNEPFLSSVILQQVAYLLLYRVLFLFKRVQVQLAE